jgi:uncharacterized membrane protein
MVKSVADVITSKPTSADIINTSILALHSTGLFSSQKVGGGGGSMEESQKIQDQLTNVRIDLRELSTKIDTLKDISKKLDDVETIAKKAMESTKSAHRRLDKIDKLINWLASTVIGAIILAVIGFIIKGGLNANP